MDLWINIIFAWFGLILSFLLIVIWGLRLIYKNKKTKWVFKANRILRKHHKLIGILLIAVSLIHGLFSSEDLLSLNLGTAAWVVSILLGLSWFLRKKLHLKKAWMHVHRVLTLLFTALVVIHIIHVGGFILDDMITGKITQPPVHDSETLHSPTPAPTPNPTIIAQTQAPQFPSPTVTDDQAETAATSSPSATSPSNNSTIYIDGTYEGVADGFGPDLTVEVVIKDSRIQSVIVVDHNERNKRYWGLPVEQIPADIIETQSTDVDSISGATMTSDGIKKAVENALAKAKR